jgi:hypothetical protein
MGSDYNVQPTDKVLTSSGNANAEDEKQNGN